MTLIKTPRQVFSIFNPCIHIYYTVKWSFKKGYFSAFQIYIEFSGSHSKYILSSVIRIPNIYWVQWFAFHTHIEHCVWYSRHILSSVVDIPDIIEFSGWHSRNILSAVFRTPNIYWAQWLLLQISNYEFFAPSNSLSWDFLQEISIVNLAFHFIVKLRQQFKHFFLVQHCIT